MGKSSTHNMIDRASAVIAILVELLIGIAAGPERRATYAIARTARRSRQRSGKW
jgi:hypothetical protein